MAVDKPVDNPVDKLVGGKPGEPELRYELWAERLEREFSFMLIPFMEPKLSTEKIRQVSARMAMLAAKRAREASALDDDDKRTAKCSGCQTLLVKAASASLCVGCLRRFKLVQDEGSEI